MHQLLPLSWDEIRRFPRYPNGLEEALFSGGYPHIFNRDLHPPDWLRSYAATYLERDVRAIGDLTTQRRGSHHAATATAPSWIWWSKSRTALP